jgi:hypothetical protein
MSGVAKKLMGTTAAGGGSTAIEDVFSTYLYTGNGSTQTITNGIDLAGEGGLVWSKWRGGVESHIILDSARNNGSSMINSDNTNAQGTAGNFIQSFNSNGYTMGSNSLFNGNTNTYASWTFRKAPRFFDVLTYTGTGSQQNISHNLDGDVGFLIVKGTSAGGTSWACWHRTFSSNQFIQLNAANTVGTNSVFFPVAPTSTQFTVGTDGDVNQSGATYVAYLFAHDPLGPSEDGSDGFIACGSVSGFGTVVNLGWEPQWILMKQTNGPSDWILADTMRGIPTGSQDALLFANTSGAETSANDWIDLTSTGFVNNVGSANFIYIAIRRGPMRAPESGTEVFDPEVGGASVANNALVTTTGFPVDMFMHFDNYTSGGETFVVDRLRGRGVQLRTQYTATEATYGTNDPFLDSNEGLINRSGSTQNESGGIFWSFRRAPEFFDAVAATATSDTDQVLNHNLAATPELIIAKSRSAVGSWYVYYPTGGVSSYLVLNSTAASGTYSNIWGSTSPTETDFRINGPIYGVGNSIVAYLFATLAGVSKVGSYTGNGSSQTIDCGFTSGARFVLIKRTDSTGDWYVWDTARGIVAGNDPHLSLNTTAAEVTTDDSIDPDSSGFVVNQVAATNINVSSASYIFMAIS